MSFYVHLQAHYSNTCMKYVYIDTIPGLGVDIVSAYYSRFS